ncbi:MAG: hypothetical protein ACFFDT_28920 [Candidatus Hodarchaeota archaeon]
MAPGKVKILRYLATETIDDNATEFPLRSYTEIWESTGLSNKLVSEYLKSLQKLKLVMRDIDTRRYAGTENATRALKIIDMIYQFEWLLENEASKPFSRFDEGLERISRELDDIFHVIGVDYWIGEPNISKHNNTDANKIHPG